MISSDILEGQFGPTHIGVIWQDAQHRIIKTIVTKSDEILELSLVVFNPISASVFPKIHHDILSGNSIGKTFQAANVAFVRDIHSVTQSSLPTHLRSYFSGKATVVDVDIFVGKDNVHYCHIIEIYSPKVVWPTGHYRPSTTIISQLDIFEQLLM